MLQGSHSSAEQRAHSALQASIKCQEQAAGSREQAAVQVRVMQNKEPDHFVQLWQPLIVHSASSSDVALYHVRGSAATNTHAVQVGGSQ